jgi:hypothetical protein
MEIMFEIHEAGAESRFSGGCDEHSSFAVGCSQQVSYVTPQYGAMV